MASSFSIPSGSSFFMSSKSFRIPIFFILGWLIFTSCSSRRIQRSNLPTDPYLSKLFTDNPGPFKKIFENPSKYRVQVIYSKIIRNKKGKPYFIDYQYNVDPSLYFYPASTVKMPIALLALEKLNELPKEVRSGSTMITLAKEPWQTPVYNDPMSEDGRPTIDQYIKKIFLVSDNDASNRLYEFLGQSRINRRVREMGYDSTEILHRLSVPMTAEQNRVANEIRFYNDSVVIYDKPSELSGMDRLTRNEKLGKGFISGGKLVSQPFDFSSRNRMLLPDLHEILRSVIFPEAVPAKQRFNITKEQREFVMKYMSEYPSKAGFPPYDPIEYWDAYCKFLLVGSEKKPIPDHIRIYNKVGDAYGFLTDIAYIVDTKNKIEFMLSATVYCNEDGIFNDDKYEYDSLGFPFLKHIGEVIYKKELMDRR